MLPVCGEGPKNRRAVSRASTAAARPFIRDDNLLFERQSKMPDTTIASPSKTGMPRRRNQLASRAAR